MTNAATSILALDIATRTGFAIGHIGGQPTGNSIRFGNASNNDDIIFGAAIAWLADYLTPHPRPDVLAIEAMLSPAAMGRMRNSAAVRDRLAGLQGALRGTASLRGIKRVYLCDVGDVRMHFIGTRTLKREAAKNATMAQCQRLGWACRDDNAADALAVWSYACARIDPSTALRTTPLFNRELVL